MLSVSLNGAWRKEGIVLQNQREGYVPGANLEGERIYSASVSCSVAPRRDRQGG
jgi:hypothetical protein